MDFLQGFIALIPKVASSPAALALYALALFAWALISWRSHRLKILLARLEALPPEDRRKVIEAEFGHLPVPEGMTVAQWLRAQRMRYRFFGFLIALLVIGALVVVGAFLSLNAPTRPAAKTPADLAQEQALVAAYGVLSHLKLRGERAYIESKLGPPQMVEAFTNFDTATYLADTYWLRLYFVPDGTTLVGYLLLAKSGAFRPPLPWFASGPAPRLGEATYASLAGGNEIDRWDAVFGGTSAGAAYMEVLFGASNATGDKHVVVATMDAGVRFEPDEGDQYNPDIRFMELDLAEPDKLPEQLQPSLDAIRAHWRPNAMAEFLAGNLPPLDELPFTSQGNSFHY